MNPLSLHINVVIHPVVMNFIPTKKINERLKVFGHMSNSCYNQQSMKDIIIKTLYSHKRTNTTGLKDRNVSKYNTYILFHFTIVSNMKVI